MLDWFHIERKFIIWELYYYINMLVRIGAALLFLSCVTSVKAATCKSGRIFLGNINETFPMHLNKIGVYVKLPDRTLFNRPVYRHEGSGQYLYYRRGAINMGLWVVGPEVGSDSASFSIQSEQADPSLIRLGIGKAWSIQTDEGWVQEPKLKSLCVDESFGECNTDILNLIFFGPTLKHHGTRAGLYDLQEQTHNLRPVYKHRENGEYLYYHMGLWIIGPEVGSTTMSLFSLDYAFRPEFIVQPWISFYHFELGNAQLNIICHGKEERTKSTGAPPSTTTEGFPGEGEGSTNRSHPSPSEPTVHDQTPVHDSSISMSQSPSLHVSHNTRDPSTSTSSPVSKSKPKASMDKTPVSNSTEEVDETTVEVAQSAHAQTKPMHEASIFTTDSPDTKRMHEHGSTLDIEHETSEVTTEVYSTSINSMSLTSVLPGEEEATPLPPRNPCLSNPCLHGGTCVPGESGTSTCLCTASYTGSHCEEVSCGPPPVTIGHGRLRRVTSQGVLGLAYYSCDDGYVSSTGHMIAMCGHSRRWVDLPSCIPSLNQLLEPLASLLRQ